MQIKIYNNKVEASQFAFKLIEKALESQQNTFGLATGSTPELLYQLLTESDLDFTQATALNLDEYYGLAANHPQSYAYFMDKHLFTKKPFKETFIPNGMNTDIDEETARYNELIDQHPIDVQILGIGANGHIGFNEPGTSFDSKTQYVELTPSTIEANQRFFDTKEDVPTHAYSMGVDSIMQAKQIILLAFGENKADAIQKTVEGPIDESVPASILQKHPNVYVILDKDAAKLLK